MQGVHGLQSVERSRAWPSIADAREVGIQCKFGGHQPRIKPADGREGCARPALVLFWSSVFSPGGGLLFGTCSGENTCKADIALLAGVLVDQIRSVFQGDHQAPWFRPGSRVVDRDFVFQAVRASAGEMLD